MSNNNLQYLLAPWCQAPNISVQQLQLDHRELVQGDLFIAIKGHQFDARRLIQNAIDNGAVAVIADCDDLNADFSISYQQDVPIVHFPHLKTHLSALSKRFYQQGESIPVIGVTGTNGKTTITQLIAQWLNLLNKPTAVMGTTGNGFLTNLQPAENTTGSALAIQRELAAFKQQHAAFVAMEVSSHGLVQARVNAVDFKAVIFSNLSRDHLDYHGDMQAYAEAKLRLFTQYSATTAVINADDQVGKAWLDAMPNAIAVSLSPLSLTEQQQGLWLTEIAYQSEGMTISFDSSWGQGQFTAALVGEFNVMNLLLSLASLLDLGFALPDLLAAAPKLRAVIGRMEVFHRTDKPMLVVDYAHTPDALEKALQALRRHCSGKLWCVFGCGGDRDKGKRPLMAAAAEKYADKLVLTNDNPRSEMPEQIMQDILQGIAAPQAVEVIYDRFAACAHAFNQASAADVILIAGKGHEDYQLFAEGALHYSDRETVQQLLERQ